MTLRLFILLLTLALPACGIITAPVSLPLTYLDSVPVHARGQVVDQDGNPLSNVTVHIAEYRQTWHPIWIFSWNSNRTTTVDGTFDISGRVRPNVESTMSLIFQKPGYYPAEIAFAHSALWREFSAVKEYALADNLDDYPYYRPAITRHGRTQMSATGIPSLTMLLDRDSDPTRPVQITMQKMGDLTRLQFIDSTLAIHPDNSGRAAQWRDHDLHDLTLPDIHAAAPPAITLDVMRTDTGAFVISNVPGWSDRRVPQKLKLSISGPGNGFIRHSLQELPSIERQMTRAPDAGYADAVFPQRELERLLRNEDNTSWFYVKINGLYGRGFVHSLKVHHPQPDAPLSADQIALSLKIWLQPDGTTNLETAP